MMFDNQMLQNEDKMKAFERIGTPQELLDFMASNIEYGFIGKNDQKRHLGEDGDMDQEYFLQTPQELIESGVGVCWDTTELERSWFIKKGYKYKTIFLRFKNESLPTHTFLAYEKDNRWIWFEHSFGMHRGIHEYESFEDLIVDVKRKQYDYAHRFCEATEEDEGELMAFEFKPPQYGCTAQEFMDQVTKEIPA